MNRESSQKDSTFKQGALLLSLLIVPGAIPLFLVYQFWKNKKAKTEKKS